MGGFGARAYDEPVNRESRLFCGRFSHHFDLDLMRTGTNVLSLQDKEGVDIFLIEFEKPDSDLAALCLRFWDEIRHFPSLTHFGPHLRWIGRKRSRSTRDSRNRRPPPHRSYDVATSGRDGQKETQSYLDVRFGIDVTSTQSVRFPIDLAGSTPRAVPQQSPTQWWTEEKRGQLFSAVASESDYGVPAALGICRGFGFVWSVRSQSVWLGNARRFPNLFRQ
jgi:hypothetical protein